ncbi:MAG: DUF1491 family protein [Sandaracinobacteroides sp.]
MVAEPQPPASLLVPALVRQVEAAGGFATVLAKGSAGGSAMLLVHRANGFVGAYAKVPTLSGAASWRLAVEGDSAIDAFVASQQKFDPDLWVLELDIADPARFVPGWPTAA